MRYLELKQGARGGVSIAADFCRAKGGVPKSCPGIASWSRALESCLGVVPWSRSLNCFNIFWEAPQVCVVNGLVVAMLWVTRLRGSTPGATPGHDSGTRLRGTFPGHDSRGDSRDRFQGSIPRHDSRARLQSRIAGTGCLLRLVTAWSSVATRPVESSAGVQTRFFAGCREPVSAAPHPNGATCTWSGSHSHRSSLPEQSNQSKTPIPAASSAAQDPCNSATCCQLMDARSLRLAVQSTHQEAFRCHLATVVCCR